MAPTRDDLSEIKEKLDHLIGVRVRVKADKGRRRMIVREGTLEKTYPSLFVVNLGPEQQNRRLTFTYTDLLTETVELTIPEESDLEEPSKRAG